MMVITAISCSKDDDDNNNASLGKITGSVQVWNDKATSLADRSGVTVVINNLSNVSTTTAADGSFSFDNLPYDNYDFSFSKSGYGTFKYFGVSHSNSSTIMPTIQFGAISTSTVSALTYVSNTFAGGPGVSYTFSMNPTPTSANRGYVRAFLSTSATVSNTNYMAYSGLRSASNNNVTGGFTADELYGMGFATGQTVFIKMYADAYQSNVYEDPATGRDVFPNINSGSPAAISFVVP
jgi:hypothetical protein